MTTTPNPLTDLLVIGTYLDEIHEALGEVAGSFTCSEADAIAVIYATVHRPEAAASFLLCHAENDEDDDEHRHVTDLEQAAAHVAALLA